jgi:Zn-dependent protease with chaperone function
MNQVIGFAVVQAISFLAALVIAIIGLFIYMWWADKQIDKWIKHEREHMCFVHHPTAGDMWVDTQFYLENRLIDKGWRIATPGWDKKGE